MNASRFIAGRLRFEGKMAMVSIAVSFFIMILALAISGGFRHEIRKGVASISGDIQLTGSRMNYLQETDPISAGQSFLPKIDSLKGVRSIKPAIYRAGILKNGENIHGVLFKGVERDDTTALSVSIPSRLATILNLSEGDDLTAYFVGEKVKLRKFHVTEVYRSILDEDDKLIVLADIDDLRRLNGWSEGQVSCLEIEASPAYRSERALADLTMEVGSIALMFETDDDDTLVATSSRQRYPMLFDWLDLIDFNVLFILLLMTLVAGFNMISGLLILLFRNISTIGTLKSLGMTDRNITSVFMRVSSHLVLKGMLIGNALAGAFCLLQGLTHLIKLNPDNYFISFVPVHISIPTLLVADAACYLVIMLLLLIPCLFIARVDPAQTVRTQ